MSENQTFGFSDLAKQASLQPKESHVGELTPNKSVSIGVPKEITMQENRVPLTPSSVKVLVSNGNEVMVETNAGKDAHFTDKDYSDAGAKIVYNKQEIFNCDVVVKVEPPTEEEINYFKPEQILISALQHGARNEKLIRSMMHKKINAIGFEYLREEDGSFPIIRSMSEIAGITSVSVAAELLSTTKGGKGEMLGAVTGIPPTELVIIGAGTVGEFAARAAIGMGAIVKVFDTSLAKLRRLQTHLGYLVYTSLLHPKILNKALQNADVAIGAFYSEDGRCPVFVSEEVVSQMKPHAVIIDISIDQGGVFETSEVTTHKNPTFIKHDIIHYCVPNITSRVSRTASYALSNILTPLLVDLSDSKNFSTYLYNNPSVRHGVYLYKGNLTNKHLGKRLNIYNKDIDLLLAAHA
jgi:alanine dehydrogenase